MAKKFILVLIFILSTNSNFAFSFNSFNNDEKAIKKVLYSQVKYANKENFNNYVNADGFNLDTYSALIKDIWKNFDKIVYSIEIKDIKINGNKAQVELLETSNAYIEMSRAYPGELKSSARTIYYLTKKNNDWKVSSDKVIDETTSMLYGDAKNLKIKLDVPIEIDANKEYCASLEFEPPSKTIAIASISSDIIEYPQGPTEEVFRALPEDNILERLFTSNNKNANEYVIASIGLTQTSMDDLNLKLNLTGFGYYIRRINVIPFSNGEKNVEN